MLHRWAGSFRSCFAFDHLWVIVGAYGRICRSTNRITPFRCRGLDSSRFSERGHCSPSLTEWRRQTAHPRTVSFARPPPSRLKNSCLSFSSRWYQHWKKHWLPEGCIQWMSLCKQNIAIVVIFNHAKKKKLHLSQKPLDVFIQAHLIQTRNKKPHVAAGSSLFARFLVWLWRRPGRCFVF